MIGVTYERSEIALWAVWLAAIGFALWRGDRFVHTLAWVYLAATVVAVAALAYGAPPTIWICADVVVLPLLMQALLSEPRRWLIAACAFELVTMATHVAWSLDRNIDYPAYSAAINVWWLAELACLVWGAVDARRARPFAAAAVGAL